VNQLYNRRSWSLAFLLLMTITVVAASHYPAGAAPPEATGATKIIPPDTDQLDAIVLSIMDQFHIPGCAVSVFCAEGFEYTGTYGFAQLMPDSIPVNEHSIFATMSVSKAITGTALMGVWDDTGFDLDADVSDYLDFAVIHPTCPDSAVTARKLAAHVSAMPQEPWGCIYGMPLCGCLGEVLDPAGAHYDPDDWADYCPGEGYLYSATNSCLAACLIEHISGQTLPDYSRTRFFEPLGMTGSAWFGDELDPELVAHSYRWDSATETYILASENGPNDFRYPAVGFRTSIHDFSRFTAAVMNGGELGGVRVLDEATVDTMFTPQYFRVTDEDMGFSWFRYHYWSSGPYWSHLGGGGNYSAAMMIHESRDYGVVLLINGGSGGLAILNEIIAFIADVYAPVPEAQSLSLDLAIHPNPFNPRTSLSFEVPTPGVVRLRVFDLRGRLIATLIDGVVEAGQHVASWSGRDREGRDVPSGVYLSRLEAGGEVVRARMTLVR